MSNAYKSNWDALYNDCKISKFLSKSFPIFAPMSRKKEKEIVRGVTVESVGAEGKAVARIDGKVVFMSNAVPGDVVAVRSWPCGSTSGGRSISKGRWWR